MDLGEVCRMIIISQTKEQREKMEKDLALLKPLEPFEDTLGKESKT